jgi:hypothetical protein
MAYYSEVLADNPLAYWRLGDIAGSGTAFDLSGNNRNGNYSTTGISFSQAGAFPDDTDTCVRLDGTSGHVSIPWSALGVTGSTATGAGYTFEMLISTTAVGLAPAAAAIVAANTSISHKRFVITLTDGAGTIDVQTGDSYVVTRGNTPINDGNWHHLVISIVNGAHPRIFIDGIEDSYSLTAWLPPSSGSPMVYVGYNERQSSHLAMTVDEFAVYNGGLSPARVAAHHAAANISTTAPSQLLVSSVHSEILVTSNASLVASAVNVEALSTGSPELMADGVFVEVLELYEPKVRFVGWGAPI